MYTPPPSAHNPLRCCASGGDFFLVRALAPVRGYGLCVIELWPRVYCYICNNWIVTIRARLDRART